MLLKLKEMPVKCLDCPVCWYETGENGETLYCVPLSAEKQAEIEGDFQKRREDCPLLESPTCKLVPVGDKGFECVACGMEYSGKKPPEINYCPNCGAKVIN